MINIRDFLHLRSLSFPLALPAPVLITLISYWDMFSLVYFQILLCYHLALLKILVQTIYVWESMIYKADIKYTQSQYVTRLNFQYIIFLQAIHV